MEGNFGELKFSVGPGRVRSALPFHRGTGSKRVAPYGMADEREKHHPRLVF